MQERCNMLICPFCDRELKTDERGEKGWDCACGEFVPTNVAVDTECKKCGGVKHEQ